MASRRSTLLRLIGCLRRVSAKRRSSSSSLADQKDHLALDAAAPQLIDELRNGRDLGGGVACVQPDRGALVHGFRAAHRVGDERLQQRRRDVVDAIEAEVLEHVQSHALAGTGQAAEDDDAHGVRTLSSPHDGCKHRRSTRARRHKGRAGDRVTARGRGAAPRGVCRRRCAPDEMECQMRRARRRLRGVMIGELFLVFLDAPIELVGQQVDGGIHVLFRGIGMNRVAADVQRRFGLLSQLLHRQHTVNVDDLIEVPRDALELLLHVSAQGRSDLDMMAGDVELHSRLLCVSFT